MMRLCGRRKFNAMGRKWSVVVTWPGQGTPNRILHVWRAKPITDTRDRVVGWTYRCARCGEPGFGA
jgi:hypothetical protein